MVYLQEAKPVLASMQIDKPVDFNEVKLGFDNSGWKDEHLAVMGRDQIEIHFLKYDNKIHPEHTGSLIHVTKVETLYREKLQVGMVHPNGPLKSQVWGMREFANSDEDRNIFQFGEKIQLCL